jgi:M6 family metalloprotease-like protein
MNFKICAPRISGRAIFAGLMLLGSTSILAQTGNSTAVQSQVAAGQRVQIEGQLEILHQDLTNGRGLYSYFLKKSDGTRVPLKFTTQPPTHLLTGVHVRADGQLSGGNLVLYSGNTNLTNTTTSQSSSASIPAPNTFGPQSTLVILVNFQDDAIQPFTVAAAQSTYFGTLNNFISENSYGQTSLTGTVVGWFTIPDSVTTCNMTQIATDAQNAAAASGVSLSNYTRFVYAFPYNVACGWAGSSYVGGSPSQNWINQSYLDIHTIDHEMGHAFGLWHSHFLDCGTSSTICSSGTTVEYGDLLDTMGVPQTASAHYNAFQKERLGWLNYGASPSIQTVQQTGTYTISPYESGGSGPNALKILKSTDSTTGAKTWYYLEARQAVGFDAFLTNNTYYTQNETTGVLFHLGTDGDGNSGDLIDMTPATPTSTGWFDASLVPGQSFQDSGAGVTITPTSVSSGGATVQITMNGGSTCTAASPTVSVSPSQSQSVSAGTPVSFSIAIKDNDSTSCAPATFSLGDYLPAGWSGTLSTPALSLSPGKSGSATVTATSPMGTANGYYNVAVSATNTSANTYNGSANATYVISSSAPQSISVSASPSTASAGQTVAVNVTVLSNGAPSAGTSVTVAVSPPSGRTQTMTGTTDSNGNAAFTYKLSKRATAGTYQVQGYITPATRGAAALGASTTFTVQ